jgi:hypothetical protein
MIFYNQIREREYSARFKQNRTFSKFVALLIDMVE